jgi:hypothetical protein
MHQTFKLKLSRIFASVLDLKHVFGSCKKIFQKSKSKPPRSKLYES